MSASNEEFAEFAKGLHGELIRPEDAKYEEARRIWNAMIDRRPAVIVRCKDADDVIQSIAFARDMDSSWQSEAVDTTCRGTRCAMKAS